MLIFAGIPIRARATSPVDMLTSWAQHQRACPFLGFSTGHGRSCPRFRSRAGHVCLQRRKVRLCLRKVGHARFLAQAMSMRHHVHPLELGMSMSVSGARRRDCTCPFLCPDSGQNRLCPELKSRYGHVLRGGAGCPARSHRRPGWFVARWHRLVPRPAGPRLQSLSPTGWLKVAGPGRTSLRSRPR